MDNARLDKVVDLVGQAKEALSETNCVTPDEVTVMDAYKVFLLRAFEAGLSTIKTAAGDSPDLPAAYTELMDKRRSCKLRLEQAERHQDAVWDLMRSPTLLGTLWQETMIVPDIEDVGVLHDVLVGIVKALYRELRELHKVIMAKDHAGTTVARLQDKWLDEHNAKRKRDHEAALAAVLDTPEAFAAKTASDAAAANVEERRRGELEAIAREIRILLLPDLCWHCDHAYHPDAACRVCKCKDVGAEVPV